jgi:hypothetical protein
MDWERLERVAWSSPPLASFQAVRREIEQRFGPPAARDLDSNGMGPFDAYCGRCACGLEIVLWRFHLHPVIRDGRSVDPEIEPSGFEIHANQLDLEHIAFHLAVPCESMSLWHKWNGPPNAPQAPQRFLVMRLDDNANTFVVRTASSSCEAEAVAREYTRRGHKQTYWVEEVQA